MGRIVLVVYKPFSGKEGACLELIREHHPLLAREALATTRKPITMRSSSGLLLEVFEWASAEAIRQAHENAAVQRLWERFAAVCKFELAVNVPEFAQPFSEFEPLD